MIKLNNKNEPSIEKPIWEVAWQNIRFDTLGVPLFADKLASSEFYSSFYTKLFSSYNGFESLPPDWLNIKTATAEAIGRQISQNASVLSYGCGLGFVEKQLIGFRPDLSVTAFDFADTAGKWIKRDLLNIIYTQTLQHSKYDVIYLSQVLYAISFSDSIDLLKSLSKHLKNHGKFILINTSITEEENSGVQIQKSVKQILITRMMDLIRPIYRFLVFPIQKSQFWGWQRNNNRYIEMATLAGLKPINIFSKANQAFIILSI